jgi:uncharacterized protein (DUF1800 family)
MSPAIALNRFGLGARPDETLPADPAGWLLSQLERHEALPPAWASQPRSIVGMQAIADNQAAARRLPDAQARQAAQQAYLRAARERYLGALGARMQSALDTPTPFVERLVHFWSNHFAISVDKAVVLGLAGAFEADAIRPHVLGRFEDLLLAVVRHPAMLLFLDQAQSVGPGSPTGRRSALRAEGRARGLNENLAREILELHTLGVRSGYTQADVTELARALTGWSVIGPNDGPGLAPGPHGFIWRPAIHEPGSRLVMGRTYADDGERQALAILHDLATAPATATHIATKLARHFVADEPPPALVQRLAVTFMRSSGDLSAVMRALVTSPEAWAEGPAKFKTPWDWSVSALRGLGRRELPPMQAANLLNQLGQPVWRPGSPAGWDDVAASWAGPDALVRRVEAAQRIGSQAVTLDARQLGPRLLPGALGEDTARHIARAESPGSALALLLVSPEFLRK